MANTAKFNEILDPLDLFGGQANREAGDVQSQLGRMGLDLERDFFTQLREDEAPVRSARNAALEFLRQIQSGEAQLPNDPSLRFQQEQATTDIDKLSAAQGKSLAGGTGIAKQDALAQLQSASTRNQLNRILNIAGYQTQDLLGSNSLIAQNTDAQANQLSNLNGIRNAADIGRSNAIFNLTSQGSRLAGALL